MIKKWLKYIYISKNKKAMGKCIILNYKNVRSKKVIFQDPVLK